MKRLFASLFSIMLMTTPLALHAQTPMASIVEEDSLPVEIKLLYMKLLNQTPDFDALIASNRSLNKVNDSFGQAALIAQQKSFLQNLYGKSGPQKNIFLSKKMVMNNANRDTRTLSLAPLNADEPIIMTMNDTEQYGVFLHNGALMETLVAPFEFDDFSSLHNLTSSGKNKFDVHLTVKPIAADPNDFTLASGESVHVILADIVRVKILDPFSGKLLIDKRFEDTAANDGLPVPNAAATAAGENMPLPPATP